VGVDALDPVGGEQAVEHAHGVVGGRAERLALGRDEHGLGCCRRASAR